MEENSIKMKYLQIILICILYLNSTRTTNCDELDAANEFNFIINNNNINGVEQTVKFHPKFNKFFPNVKPRTYNLIGRNAFIRINGDLDGISINSYGLTDD